MNRSILRYPKSKSVLHLAWITSAMEYGFIAAGVTVSVVAIVEAFVTVLNWFSVL